VAAKILDGLKAAADIKAELKREVAQMAVPPCLGVVLCSDDPASELYVRKKQDACAEVGITSRLVRPLASVMARGTPIDRLLADIKALNGNPSITGVLVQLPLGCGLNPHSVFDCIDPEKDVDVFSPVNVGLLLQGRPRFLPCTPSGIRELLVRNGIEIEGKKVCIINRSDVVGKPLHAMLIQNNTQANATVTLCHDRTPPDRLREICLRSDIIVVAVGKPGFLTADMVPDGAVVVDVGISRVEGSKKIVGDVDFAAVAEVAGWISPVPGGVGPMTVAMLLRNTVAAKLMQDNRFYTGDQTP
jgi:methylenetetrahydrofolate dehydrogenase (NADP+) / methenyltetrahydrofolate cyclohydrolase